jgi:hypothetical protein
MARANAKQETRMSDPKPLDTRTFVLRLLVGVVVGGPLVIGGLLLPVPASATDRKLTPDQLHTFNQLIGIGLTKKDAERVARDPGVKKNEWGWVCEGGGGNLIRQKGSGARYKRNAVCE